MKNTLKTVFNKLFNEKGAEEKAINAGDLIHKDHGEPLVYVGNDGRDNYAMSLFHRYKFIKLESLDRYKTMGSIDEKLFDQFMLIAESLDPREVPAVLA